MHGSLSQQQWRDRFGHQIHVLWVIHPKKFGFFGTLHYETLCCHAWHDVSDALNRLPMILWIDYGIGNSAGSNQQRERTRRGGQ